MIEVGVAQAQANFTKLLDKAGEKKSSFAGFVGLLDKDFKTDDARYNKIVK